MAAQDRALHRTLGLSSVVLFGLAYMLPMIVFGTFGVLAEASEGTAAGPISSPSSPSCSRR